MTEMPVQNRHQQAVEYLKLMRSLRGELERAMQAIAGNRLMDLEESLAEQESLAARLAVLRGQALAHAGGQGEATGSGGAAASRISNLESRLFLDQRLAGELSAANNELQQTNRIYARVLDYSKRSTARMASLMGSFSGNMQEASGPRLRCQTWSCRM